MNHVKIKICGLTREEDIKSAVSCGADAIGLNFTTSPRRISAETAVRLSSCIPHGVLRVGLFMNQEKSEIDRVISSVALDVLQFHGDESEHDCDAYGLPWLKAVRMEDSDSVSRAERDYPSAMGLLLDSHSKGGHGGSGKVFDWALSTPISKPVWLAGGLNAANVGEAIRIVKPYAVDVSSGVETAPGIKDARSIRNFINAVRDVENDLANGNQQ
jgi:phosphoribosylanthranilate isomerase